MGLTAREGMELELNLNIKNEQAAQQFAQLLSSQLQLAMLAQADIPGAAEVFRKLAVRAEGKQMRVHLTLTKEEVEQQLRTLQSARAATPGAPTAHSQIPTKPGKVKIYGLDEGVREIQLTH